MNELAVDDANLQGLDQFIEFLKKAGGLFFGSLVEINPYEEGAFNELRSISDFKHRPAAYRSSADLPLLKKRRISGYSGGVGLPK